MSQETYVVPSIEVITFELEGMVALSTDIPVVLPPIKPLDPIDNGELWLMWPLDLIKGENANAFSPFFFRGTIYGLCQFL